MAERLASERSIATRYRRFQFRSRLEAKWAVFFDLCGWPWAYEPLDLAGWIPDFAVGERPTLVEIKPFFTTDEWHSTRHKIAVSGCDQPVALLGADPVWMSVELSLQKPLSTSGGAPIIGWALLPDDSGELESWPLNFGFTEGNDRLGLCALDGPWRNLIWKLPGPTAPKQLTATGKADRVWLAPANVEQVLVARWAKACNVSQWIKHDDQPREHPVRTTWPAAVGAVESGPAPPVG